MPRDRTDAGIASGVVGAVAHALAELGIALPSEASAGTFVSGASADALIDDAARRLGDDALALSLAQRLTLGVLGDLDYALCTSATLREGAQRTARYYGVVTQRVRLELVESPPRASFVYTREAGANRSRHWAELGPAMIAVRMRQTLGRPVRFVDVRFSHDAPPDPAVHDAFFGVRVRWSQPLDELAFPSELLDLPLLTASTALAEVLEARMRAFAPPDAPADPLLDRARRAVVEALEVGEAGLANAARRIGTSTRTLQRELQRRGTSHQALLDEARRDRAQRMLEGGASVADVASALGFSEPSAFFRAFRRWTGNAPRPARGEP